tara:strand:+ start:2447 stop:2806 length:360 start_codon:yes stop_codon:yes gene_type:complete
MKVIIAGGRDFEDVPLMKGSFGSLCGLLQQPLSPVEVVSGGARGADACGEYVASEVFLPVKVFPADWGKHGKSAGYIRNSEMADYADVLLAFWDGKSKGTKHMIDLALKKGLLVKVVRY